MCRPAEPRRIRDYAGEAVRGAARTVHVPGEFRYDEARRTRSPGTDLRPAAVAFPDSLAEVSSLVRAAAEAGLRVAPIGTGHNVFPLGDLSETVLLRTSRLAEVKVYPEAGRVRAEAGALWLPVTEEAARHGLAALHGSPVQGVAGHQLGGGISWYGRRHGLAVNHITAVELILADGTYVRTDADNEPDLFWAVRGGGANFGVVTAIEFELIELATAYAGMLVWDLVSAREVLPRWLAWSTQAPEDVTTAYRHVRFPVEPGVSEPLRGRDLVIVDGAVLGDDERAERILAPLRELRPERDTFARMPVPAVRGIRPDSAGRRSVLLGDLPPEAAAEFVEAAGPHTNVDAGLRQLGGALGRAVDGGGALTHLDAAYELRTDEGGILASLDAYRRGRPVDEVTRRRLTELRTLYDPAGVLQAGDEIPVSRCG
ncbi:FAD-binding protein [Actinoplanes sp. TBRC 11911]|uniref:FAD-binding oxidoreductase n=1 Tax=Actinoplanes sp. TBRC 11911 TaxID=2729386 RepID=UPI00145CDE63|nr:FAD-dependent oxidoreductase [Actinoplanes sp. TBRC 11911]NMO49666.1 FAD-binding protein [Actinoplanes sp. TBRC 11911]